MLTYKSNRLLIIGLLATAFTLIACEKATVGTHENLAKAGAAIVNNEMAVTTEQLSDRIIKQHNDYALYDIRSMAAFEQGHIKTAKLARIAQLLSDVETIAAGKDIIVYSSLSETAAQVATLLRVSGRNAFYLDGGFEKWHQQMKNVSGTPSDSSEAQQMAKQQAISCWFEGDYIAAAGLTPKVKPSQSAKSQGGYVPPLDPVTNGEGDELGLGLDLGLGPAEETSDALGLGLELGLGPDDALPKKKHKLNIGEGC